MAERFDKLDRPAPEMRGPTVPNQKIELLADIGSPDAPAIAFIESAGIAGSEGVEVGSKSKNVDAINEAAAMVNAERPGLVAKLRRDPNGDELVAAVLAGPNAARFRKVEAK